MGYTGRVGNPENVLEHTGIKLKDPRPRDEEV